MTNMASDITRTADDDVVDATRRIGAIEAELRNTRALLAASQESPATLWQARRSAAIVAALASEVGDLVRDAIHHSDLGVHQLSSVS